MYTHFYQLNQKPFQINSDPAFMWMGEKHKEALATLKYGILDNKGFLLLTGDVGTGKTTLINALIESLSDDVISATVPDPGLEKMDFFNFIATGFGIEKEFSSKGSFLAYFRNFLIQANEEKKKVLLIIDESQRLSQEMLEEIRLLSNIEKTDAKLINIFFIGQNEFNEILNQNQNRAVRQRLTLNYNIDPLTPDETGEYIRHRLNVAGAAYPIFQEDAIQEVFLYSGGFPRRINVICDHCLLSGFVKEKKTIDAAIVKECAMELKIPSYIRNRDIDGFDSSGAQNRTPVPPISPQALPLADEKNIQTKKMQYIIGTFALAAFFIFAVFFSFPGLFKEPIEMFSGTVRALKNQIYGIGQETSRFQAKDSGTKTQDSNQGKDPAGPLQSETIAKAINAPENASSLSAPLKSTEESSPVEKNTVEGVSGVSAQKVHPIPEGVSQASDSAQAKSMTKDKAEAPHQDKNSMPLPKGKLVVRFKYDNNDFTDEALNKLIEFADILIKHPESSILITGYTDAEGYEKYNQKLSEFRANIVSSFFLGRGVKPEQIEVIGAGSKNPVDSNETPAGRMMNRRVEIEVKKK